MLYTALAWLTLVQANPVCVELTHDVLCIGIVPVMHSMHVCKVKQEAKNSFTQQLATVYQYLV